MDLRNCCTVTVVESNQGVLDRRQCNINKVILLFTFNHYLLAKCLLFYFHVSLRTYGDCEFRPGPHLNVVLGPNGMIKH